MTSGDNWYLSSGKFDNFNWLRDLRSFGGSQARSTARTLIKNWIDQNASWNICSWNPETMATRLANLVFCYNWYGSAADEAFQHSLANSLHLQARCLARDWQRLYSLEARITALKGLYVTEAALGASASDLDKLMEILTSLTDSRLHPDGGHKSRMPDMHLRVMRNLIEIRNASPVSQLDQFKWLENTISKMAAICRMWRHADGQFARFNGAGFTDPAIVEETLARSGQRGKLLQTAPYSGFARFSSGRSTVIMDCGSPEVDAKISGLSTLGFEFSIGQNLLVVNPGQVNTEANLQNLLRSTKAHSALTLDGYDSSDLSTGRIAKVKDLEMGAAEGGFLFVASHDGYESSHGITHQRKLYLATGGGNLRGSDVLEYTGAPGEIARLAIIRFHLHPRVSAAMLHDQRVLIKIRGNRAGWVFRTSGTVALDNSLFFDINGRMNCQQIVVTKPIFNIRSTGTISINWAFQRSNPA
jgi:uncharacterized heparinase superfamily protein